ncbi:UrcA family protein [Phenylobacterium terrae]|uniref:UrcA family protein n=1 Tax=Phenylobacterium terrae TaxID=2665495 RepID=A0ABW4MXD1_9CAUL
MTNYTNKIAGIAAIALAALPLVAIAGIAEAAPATVQVSDLDLSTAEGKAQFKARVNDAARDFCRGKEITGSRTGAMRSCIAGVEAEMTEKLAAQQSGAQTFAAR